MAMTDILLCSGYNCATTCIICALMSFGGQSDVDLTNTYTNKSCAITTKNIQIRTHLYHLATRLDQ